MNNYLEKPITSRVDIPLPIISEDVVYGSEGIVGFGVNHETRQRRVRELTTYFNQLCKELVDYKLTDLVRDAVQKALEPHRDKIENFDKEVTRTVNAMLSVYELKTYKVLNRTYFRLLDVDTKKTIKELDSLEEYCEANSCIYIATYGDNGAIYDLATGDIKALVKTVVDDNIRLRAVTIPGMYSYNMLIADWRAREYDNRSEE